MDLKDHRRMPAELVVKLKAATGQNASSDCQRYDIYSHADERESDSQSLLRQLLVCANRIAQEFSPERINRCIGYSEAELERINQRPELRDWQTPICPLFMAACVARVGEFARVVVDCRDRIVAER
jgi:hypothetical protein